MSFQLFPSSLLPKKLLRKTSMLGIRALMMEIRVSTQLIASIKTIKAIVIPLQPHQLGNLGCSLTL